MEDIGRGSLISSGSYKYAETIDEGDLSSYHFDEGAMQLLADT
jgi:hypothetical protein